MALKLQPIYSAVCECLTHAAKARERIGDLRWSLHVARLNYQQFGGQLDTGHRLLDMLGDEDLGDQRPVVTTASPPDKIKEAERAAADDK